MIIDNISRSVPCIQISQTVEEALSLYKEYDIDHLVVCKKEDFIGILSLEQLEHEKRNSSLDRIKDLIEVSINENDSFSTLWLAISLNNLSVVPIVNSQNILIRSIKTQDVISELERQFDQAKEGSIVVFSVKKINYSIKILATIAEEMHINIEHLFQLNKVDNEEMIISLRIDSINTEQFKNALNRHNMDVVMIYSKGNKFESLKERYDELMHYLNV